MREVVFLKRNEAKWRDVEVMLASGGKNDPDKLANLFIELNDDLAYARTNYPESKTEIYLNGLASNIYEAIYKNKKEKSNRFVNFWKYELPLTFSSVHKQLLYSFVFFTLSCLIGVVSTSYDDNFPRIILGDQYVETTLDNIEKGDPMAIYKDADSGSMFFSITTNNIRVSFYTFLSGFFISFGSYWFLFRNGVMLGAFQWFFFKKGLLTTSFLTIWIHGTIEISCIIIAGAAGIVLGNSILFPGTYSRKLSLIAGAKKSSKIFLGIIPLIIIAGFLESFVTRLTDSHWSIRLLIIISSAAFVLYYFVFYPLKLKKENNEI